jgi:hypothetical protein
MAMIVVIMPAYIQLCICDAFSCSSFFFCLMLQVPEAVGHDDHHDKEPLTI